MKRLCHKKKQKRKKKYPPPPPPHNWDCGATTMMHKCENRKSKGVRGEGLPTLMFSISFFPVPKILPVTGSYDANVNILFQHWNSSINQYNQYKGGHAENIKMEYNLALVSLIVNPGMNSGMSHPRPIRGSSDPVQSLKNKQTVRARRPVNAAALLCDQSGRPQVR